MGFTDNRELGPTVVKKGVALKLFEDEQARKSGKNLPFISPSST